MFKLQSSFKPTGDQPQAIEKLIQGINFGLKNQVLLGVTGSGKTFTMANVIEKLQMPALIISHNKTLAGQLYQEMRDFFPTNGVSYFVSYYDYYQPEAYIPQTDTYIEKEAQINQLIDKLRLQATTNILTRQDTIVVASVSCIYNLGSPVEFGRFILELNKNEIIDLNKITLRLAQLQYSRSEFDFKRGTFRLRGNFFDIYPAYEDFGYRICVTENKIEKILQIDPLTGKEEKNELQKIIIYPAKHYMTDPQIFSAVEQQIRKDLDIEVNELKNKGKNLEAERLIKRVNYDLEMIKEVGYVNGIENYSRYFDGRKPGDPPFTLLDYFQRAYGENWLLFIDESHMTIPQLRGMYNGDYSRKKILVEYGFRLKAAFDNRPLKFEEFYQIPRHIIYFSATPDEWELNQAKNEVLLLEKKTGKKAPHNGLVEQLIRPTGIIDPKIIVRPAKNEIEDLINEIKNRVNLRQRVLVTTLTKRIAEDLASYLKDLNIKANYLHSDIETLERSDILDNLRLGKFDVLIGVNLLREGLDLPEVTLVAILDADKEGFLRSKTSLIQTMGRAARNVKGEVIIYADKMTKSLKEAINEIERRRKFQIEFNKKNKIIPQTIEKPIRKKIIEDIESEFNFNKKQETDLEKINSINPEGLTPYDLKKIIKKLEKEMRHQAENLNFEIAIALRDKVRQLKSYLYQ
jgi:excinuclease ABC subunit B